MIDEILRETRAYIEVRMSKRPLSEVKALATATKRSLAKALRQPRSSMILECKKASPSQGVIRPDFDISAIIKAYDPFADAISVLTNEKFFQGSLDYLKQARQHTNKPLLCKDFILSPFQIYEARLNDADAVLLMMSLLSDDEFKENFETASSLGMDVLVEVHDEEELHRALHLGAKIIGVNSRDFKTLKVDLKTAERLLPQIPQDRIAIFESGISTHQQILDYRSIAQGFLVGTSLMKQPNLSNAVRELVLGRVKVCGLTRNEDARKAQQLGARFGGLIFSSSSPRCVSFEEAQDISRSCSLDFVGVFVNHTPAFVADYVKRLKLHAVQLHGDEDAQYVRNLRALIPGTEIWKALRVSDKIDNARVWDCDRILLDSYVKDQRGGTGRQFDWSLLKGLNKERAILSGGLNPSNAREADEQRLWALDVNSGVESAPGIKDEKKLRAFFEELR